MPELAVDLEQLAAELGEQLKRKNWSLAVAESCTGGWLAETVTAIPGSSAWFERGFVTYSNLAKQQMLGVEIKTLEKYGAVSEQTVREMAWGALEHSQARISVAISGVAGPDGGTPDKPVGTVWLAWAWSRGCETRREQFEGDRRQVRRQAVAAALQGLLERT